MPSLHGTKTIALGTRSATHIVSCAAPEGMRMNGSPVAAAACLERADDPLVQRRRARSVWRSRYSARHPALLARLRRANAAISRATPR